jgi:murein DD-endopeptidase MepM/ murein hydrolase activator NlpD
MGWLIALGICLRVVVQFFPVVALFVMVTALSGGLVESGWLRLALGALVSLGVPLLLYARVASFLENRKKRAPSAEIFVPITDVVIALVLCFGFADDMGRALRRHGDWFVGEERHGAVARVYRNGVGAVAAYLEKFDPPAQLATVILPPDPEKIPMGPWRQGETPPEAQPIELAWFHPLAGPYRQMPISEGRRFGASRPPPRPAECELGHCGVDLGSTIGEPVFAIFDGVVERVQRDESHDNAADERAGRFVRIGHKDGTVVSRYIHLDTIRSDLRDGMHVKAGELIGRLGATGIHNSAPHLHFAVSLRPTGRGGAETYIDPEPMLRRWKMVDGSTLVAAR